MVPVTTASTLGGNGDEPSVIPVPGGGDGAETSIIPVGGIDGDETPTADDGAGDEPSGGGDL
jgi:hypothetical protein